MKTIFTCLFISVVLFGFGQQNTFKVRAYSSNFSYLSQIIQLADGSFVAVGNAGGDFNFYGISAYLLKTDADGHVLASKTLYTGNSNPSTGLIKTLDGGFAVCGRFGAQPGLIKFAADLTEEWQSSYLPVDAYVNIFRIQQTRDSGYMIIGGADNSTSGGNSISSGLLIKTDSQGQLQFAKSYSDTSTSIFYDVAATEDSNYVLVGKAGNFVQTDTLRILKVRQDGSIIWSRNFYNTNYTMGTAAITSASDGSVIITGEAILLEADSLHYLQMITKYDSAGNRLWSKSIGTPGYSQVIYGSVTEDRDGGYLFGSELSVFQDAQRTKLDTSYGYIIKTDTAGNLLWTKTLEPTTTTLRTTISSIIATADGGYAACGNGYFYHDSSTIFNSESFIYKFDSNFVACNEATGSRGYIVDFGTGNIGAMPSPVNLIFVNNSFLFVPFDEGTTINVCNSSVLPLQLLSFNATLQNKSVAVQWSTANEVNTNYFIVERSRNATAFTALQQVAAKGNSAGVQTYSTTDFQPLAGTSYYRLKEVDKDGKITYSSIVPVTVLHNGVVIISPNPVQNSIRVVMQSTANASVTYQIIDMKETVLATQKTSVSTGRNEIVIPAASLAKGIYVLKVIENNAVQTIRFVKE